MSAGGKGGASRIGFVGVGIMGHGMAGRLLAAEFPLTVIAHHNRRPVDDLVGRGAAEAGSYAELAGRSDVIILCVSNSRVVDEIVDALAPHLRPGMILIDCSTNTPEASRRIARHLADMGVAFAEAPLTGGIKQAEAGELGALAGAEPETLARIRPVLDAFCRTVQHFGPPGAGQTAKLINNFMVLGMAALVFEAFERAETAGVDWAQLYDVMICGSGDSGVLRRMIGSAIEGDFKGYVFNVANAAKDLRYFDALTRDLGGPTALSRAVVDMFRAAEDAGHGARLISELLNPETKRTNS